MRGIRPSVRSRAGSQGETYEATPLGYEVSRTLGELAGEKAWIVGLVCPPAAVGPSAVRPALASQRLEVKTLSSKPDMVSGGDV